MESKQIPLSDLVSMGYPGNPKEHDIGAIITSLQTFGFIDPVIVNSRTNRILSGHGRVQALVEVADRPAGIDAVGDVWLVPCDFVDLPEEQEGAAVIALNRTVELGGWDQQALAELLASFAGDEALLNATGYDADDLDALLAEFAPESDLEDVEPQIDRAEELRQKWGVEMGQLWQLGEHRIICGDCTDAAVVERVMGGELPDLVIADPPYGVNIVATNRFVGGGEAYDIPFGGVKNRRGTVGASKPFGSKKARGSDGSANVVEVGKYAPIVGDETTDTAIGASGYFTGLYPGAVHVWWGANYYASSLSDSSCWLVWNKETTGNFADCELAWTNQKRAARLFTHRWNGMLRDSERERRWHPTQKPAALFAWVYELFLDVGNVVLDPFMGSAPSIIAGHGTGMMVRAIEVSEDYVAVAIERWHQVTGKEPVLLDTE